MRGREQFEHVQRQIQNTQNQTIKLLGAIDNSYKMMHPSRGLNLGVHDQKR